ncbi:hypothetical protein [Belliella aquatica]|nr:hypothetical protein [Belliella aquatica]
MNQSDFEEEKEINNLLLHWIRIGSTVASPRVKDELGGIKEE